MIKTILSIFVSVVLTLSINSAFAEAKKVSQSKTAVVKEAQQTKVNINQASVEQLMLLNGIGETKAKAIIAYRKQHGAFKKVEDLANVKGIGPAILKNNQGMLVL